jgi:hypothetical protein
VPKKSCYGNYMMLACEGHYRYIEVGCFSETSMKHGVCNCKYKKYCSVDRQMIQDVFRSDNTYGYDCVEKCEIYKLRDQKIKSEMRT